jgi:protein gp37
MSVRTGIQWAHHTHSPWTGCTRVSDGCTNCYAEALSRRFSDTFGAWGPSALRKRASDASVRAVRAWDRAAARAGERRRVFPSMCDPFDKQAPSSWRREFFALIDACPNLDFLLLTKRPQNIGKSDTLSNLPNVWLGVTAENQREADRRIPLLQEIPATIRFVCIEPMLE